MDSESSVLQEPTRSLLRTSNPVANVTCVCESFNLPKFPSPLRYVSNIIAVLKALGIAVSNKDPTQLQEIHKGVYEGGFLLWECERDCLTYVNMQFQDLQQQCQLKQMKALEIGCGSGLVGIALLQAGFQHVVFQDYNPEVLQYWTAVNVGLNFPEHRLNDSCSFIKGDWSLLGQEMNTDLIKTLTTPGLAEEKYDLTDEIWIKS